MSRDEFEPPDFVSPDTDEDPAQQDPGPPDGFDPARFLRDMRDSEWDALREKLGAFADAKVRLFRWAVPPDPHDLVMENLGSLYARPMIWKPWLRKKPIPLDLALEKFLYDAIWFDILRLSRKCENIWRVDNQDEEGGDRLDSTANDGESPEEHLQAAKRREAISRIEQFLDPRGYGDLFRLYIREGLKSAEIADRLHLAVERVYSLTQQMKELLRRNFGHSRELEEILADI